MKKKKVHSERLKDRFDCFGHYDSDDTVCRDWCQLNIRCAIAQHQYVELEILEDLVYAELDSDRIQ
jgi:hypothetical protein